MPNNNYDGSIRINTNIETDQFNKKIKNVGKNVDSVNNIVKKLTKTIGAAFTVASITALSKKAIELASSLEEVQNVVDVSFGKNANKIDAFAKQAIENLGMSELAYKQFSSSYMVMGKSMGIAEDKAFDMAVALTQLTGDMSSFYNISQDVANTALKSIYTGETESLKKYGIVMTEVNLKNFALSKGINKNIDDMNQAEKTQLRYLYVTEQLSLASGDFVRTQDSWANQTRILSERTKVLLSLLGQDLIKLLTPGIKAINSLVSKITDIYSAFRMSVGLVSEESKVLGDDLSDASEKAAESQSHLADSINESNDAVKKSLASFDDLTILKNDLAKSDEIAFDLGFNNNEEPVVVGDNIEISPKIQEVIDEISNIYNEIKDVFQELKPTIKSSIDFIVEQNMKIRDTFKEIFDEAIKPLLPQFKELFNGLLDIYYDIQPDIENIIDSLLKVVKTVMNTFSAVAPAIMDLLGAIVDELKPFISNLMKFIDDLINYVLEIYKIIEPIIIWFIEAIIEKLKPQLEDFFVFVNKLLKDLSVSVEGAKKFIDALKKIFDEFLKGPDKWDKDVFKRFFSQLFDGIVDIVKAPVNAIIGLLNNAIKSLVNGINHVIDLANQIKIDFPDWIGINDIGFNINKLTAPKIPYLAKGAVIPPNSEFLAVLGDQKSGRNIETPEALLRQIYREESNNSEIINLLSEILKATKESNIYLDGRKLARGLYEYNKEMIRIKGGGVN